MSDESPPAADDAVVVNSDKLITFPKKNAQLLSEKNDSLKNGILNIDPSIEEKRNDNYIPPLHDTNVDDEEEMAELFNLKGTLVFSYLNQAETENSDEDSLSSALYSDLVSPQYSPPTPRLHIIESVLFEESTLKGNDFLDNNDSPTTSTTSSTTTSSSSTTKGTKTTKTSSQKIKAQKPTTHGVEMKSPPTTSIDTITSDNNASLMTTASYLVIFLTLFFFNPNKFLQSPLIIKNNRKLIKNLNDGILLNNITLTKQSVDICQILNHCKSFLSIPNNFWKFLTNELWSICKCKLNKTTNKKNKIKDHDFYGIPFNEPFLIYYKYTTVANNINNNSCSSKDQNKTNQLLSMQNLSKDEKIVNLMEEFDCGIHVKYNLCNNEYVIELTPYNYTSMQHFTQCQEKLKQLLNDYGQDLYVKNDDDILLGYVNQTRFKLYVAQPNNFIKTIGRCLSREQLSNATNWLKTNLKFFYKK